MSNNEDTELDNLNQSQKVNSPDNVGKGLYKDEPGKKWRQFLAAVLCEFFF